MEVIELQELIEVLKQQIIEIRENTPKYKELEQSINDLTKFINDNNFNKMSRDKTQIVTVYKSIIGVSLKIRNLLSLFDSEESKYKTIGYALYYKGKRYYADELNLNWLGINNTTGELYIKLGSAVKDLQEQIGKTVKETILEAFSNHYSQFKNYIVGMYQEQNKHEVGDLKLNYGHIAEAHEWHLQDKHKELYYKSLMANEDIDLTDLEKSVLSKMKKAMSWDNGDADANLLWSYIRSAMGTQRGTVAGDAKQAQVKQVKETYFNEKKGKWVSSSSSLSLSTLSNLLLGFKIYGGIFSLKDPQIVATEIAMYIASFLDNKIAGTINGGLLEKIVNDEFDITKLDNKILTTQISL